ncbi:MAG: U32 family peptidase [Bacteroidaceae bacterium]|nr:U32 family peptidase [Bacteroidaceae bacterium]
MKQIELLAPAKNADIGIEAIRHGADAVYIGASEFGARAGAKNDIDDIKRLVDYAHIFGAKVYVTVNTIIYEDEMADVEAMIWKLYEIGVDALIVQDFGLLGMNLPPIRLHASTQMDNRTADKVRFLADLGYEQVVLARELTPSQIAAIHEACPDVALEVFVHGAMCVSYSGQCYASEAIFGRSANRGECAQLCRMEYDLISKRVNRLDEEGQVLARSQRLLSIKDNCQIDNLEKLMDAGATSFKIEGRLKDMDYVKNVVADYSRKLDEIIARRPDEYVRASSGRSKTTFEPDWQKSFFRSMLFQHKSIGEYLGKVKDVYTNHFTIGTTKKINNGDGVCILDEHDNIFGFRINRAEGNALFPLELPKSLRKGMAVYRNQDQRFEQLLSKPSAERRISVTMTIDDTDDGFALGIVDEDGFEAHIEVECAKELARTHQTENVIRQLSKMGDTPFAPDNIDIRYKKNWFIPSSQLAEWRRELTSQLLAMRKEAYDARAKEGGSRMAKAKPTVEASDVLPDNYLANVANSKAEVFYREHGVDIVQRAFELTHSVGVPVMFCKHCIRRSLGICKKKVGASAKDEVLFIRLANGQEFQLDFDCEKCEMVLVKN